MKDIGVWIKETRPQFLPLTVVLALLGSAIAGYDGVAHAGYAALAGFGLLLAHISVNTLNDYFDYRSGVDLATRRTPFSGGSGILPAGRLRPRQVLWLGLGTLILAVPIGIYFIVVQGWPLLPLLLVAAFFILLYSPYILKRPWPEWAAGVGMGTLPVLGMYFAQAGHYTWALLVAAVPSGILVHNLLLLNEFPDAEADKVAHRMTMAITAGKRRAAVFFAAATLLVYLWIIGWALAGVMPLWALLGLLTLPLALRAVSGALHYDDPAKLMSGMAANVMVVLLTQLLMAVGYIIAAVT